VDDEGPCGLVYDNGTGLHQQLDQLLGIETLLRDLIGPGKSQQSARRSRRQSGDPRGLRIALKAVLQSSSTARPGPTEMPSIMVCGLHLHREFLAPRYL